MKLIKLILLVCLISTILSRKTNRRKKKEVSDDLLKEILKNTEKNVPIQQKDWMNEKVLKQQEFGVGEKEADYDIFKINEKSGRNPLVFAFYYAVYEFGLNNLVEESKMNQFLFNIQHLYQDVPYHNKKHPADMIMRLVYWKKRIVKSDDEKNKDDRKDDRKDDSKDDSKDDPKSLFIKMFDKSNEKNIELLELLVAIAGHDAFHPGLMNHQVCPKEKPELLGHLNIYCQLQKACNYEYPEILERVAALLTANLFKKHFFFKGVEADKYKLDGIENIVKNCKTLTYKDGNDKPLYDFDEIRTKNPIVDMILSTEFMFGGILKAKLIKMKEVDQIKGKDSKIDESEQRKLIMLLLDVGNPFALNTEQNLKLSSFVECEFVVGRDRLSSELELVNTPENRLKWILFDQSIFVLLFGKNFFEKMNQYYSEIGIKTNLDKSILLYTHDVKKEKNSSIANIVSECVNNFHPEKLQAPDPVSHEETEFEKIAAKHKIDLSIDISSKKNNLEKYFNSIAKLSAISERNKSTKEEILQRNREYWTECDSIKRKKLRRKLKK